MFEWNRIYKPGNIDELPVSKTMLLWNSKHMIYQLGCIAHDYSHKDGGNLLFEYPKMFKEINIKEISHWSFIKGPKFGDPNA